MRKPKNSVFYVILDLPGSLGLLYATTTTPVLSQAVKSLVFVRRSVTTVHAGELWIPKALSALLQLSNSVIRCTFLVFKVIAMIRCWLCQAVDSKILSSLSGPCTKQLCGRSTVWIPGNEEPSSRRDACFPWNRTSLLKPCVFDTSETTYKFDAPWCVRIGGEPRKTKVLPSGENRGLRTLISSDSLSSTLIRLLLPVPTSSPLEVSIRYKELGRWKQYTRPNLRGSSSGHATNTSSSEFGLNCGCTPE